LTKKPYNSPVIPLKFPTFLDPEAQNPSFYSWRTFQDYWHNGSIQFPGCCRYGSLLRFLSYLRWTTSYQCSSLVWVVLPSFSDLVRQKRLHKLLKYCSISNTHNDPIPKTYPLGKVYVRNSLGLHSYPQVLQMAMLNGGFELGSK